jgi:hypothetical protein
MRKPGKNQEYIDFLSTILKRNICTIPVSNILISQRIIRISGSFMPIRAFFSSPTFALHPE